MAHRQRNLWLIAVWLICDIAVGTQVCTTVKPVNDDFNGISGSSDSSVVAVGKDGTIARWDGTAWAVSVGPTDEDLLDVEMLDPDTAFAVGKKGTVLHLAGGVWTLQPTPTNKELQGVWAAAADTAWAVGKNGTVLYWDGVTWRDDTAAAQTDNKELTDVWGDSASVYALNKDGVLHRYDRAAGTWDPPDETCRTGGGFEDLWGDAAGNIYLVKKKEVYHYDGAACTVVATASKDLLGVYGVAATDQVVAVGKDARVLEFDGTAWSETDEGVDDLRDDWVSRYGNAYYAGKKGELTSCQCVDCIVPGFVLTHDGYGIHCVDETVRVDVIDTLTGNPFDGYSGQLVLDTGTGSGDWSLLLGGGGFSDPAADGRAGYIWPDGETSADFALRYRSGPPLLDIETWDTVDPGTRDDDSEGLLTFSASGFTVTATPLPNPPPAVIAPYAGPVTAGTEFTLHLTAFGQTANDPECGVIESYTGARGLHFWSSWLDPGSGSVAATIDGTAIAAAEAGSAAQPVLFGAGQASVVAKYKDVGRLQISLKDVSDAHPDLPGGIRGATAPFVARPDRFVLTGIAAAGGPNPGAADATGPVFAAAGEPFAVTVTALDAEGDPTPNYGRESIRESVALTPVLVAPAAGVNPPVVAPAGFGAFTGGQASGTDFSWSEVGIVRLLPAVGDGDYLGTGDVSGDLSGNVGRFVPHHFATAVNAPTLDTWCDAGGFTYLGQPFAYLVAPVIAITAQAAANTTTVNYTGAFWKLTNTSLANRLYTAATGTLDIGGLPPPLSDPLVADLGAGTGTATFSAGSGLAFVRGTPVAAFDAAIELAIDVRDADGVAALANPVTFGSPGGIAFDGGRSMVYGRAVVAGALGSERIDLAVPMRVETSLGGGVFARHAADQCSIDIALALTAFAGNLSGGATCVLDSGAPGASAAGCAAPAPLPRQYREPPLAGDFNLFLRAPGVGNDGSVTVEATVPAWLRYDWDAGLPGDENPAGRVTFGIYRGDDRTIYRREIY